MVLKNRDTAVSHFHLMDFPLIPSQTIPRESLLDIKEKVAHISKLVQKCEAGLTGTCMVRFLFT